MPKPKERPLLTISISGPEVKPGRISVPVLLKLCQEAQAAISRQAEANEARRSETPSTDLVHRECTLELIALKRGSTTLDFARANKQVSLLPEMAAVSIEAASAVATTLLAASQKRGKWKPSDPGVLDALDDLGSIFDAGIDKVKWIVPRQNGHRRTAAEFVPATLRRVAASPSRSLRLPETRAAKVRTRSPTYRQHPLRVALFRLKLQFSNRCSKAPWKLRRARFASRLQPDHPLW